MGFTWRRRKSLGHGAALNLSKSGVSASKRLGRVTVSSKGRGSIRLGKGGSFKFKI